VTARQIFLFKLLNAPLPTFGHVTLASQPNGQKLSKQNLAPALELKDAGINIWSALAFLGQNPPQELCGAKPKELLDWGKVNWRRHKICGLSAVYTLSC
jgi:glutamyl-Q tRNA(Asp) synthetase